MESLRSESHAHKPPITFRPKDAPIALRYTPPTPHRRPEDPVQELDTTGPAHMQYAYDVVVHGLNPDDDERHEFLTWVAWACKESIETLRKLSLARRSMGENDTTMSFARRLRSDLGINNGYMVKQWLLRLAEQLQPHTSVHHRLRSFADRIESSLQSSEELDKVFINGLRTLL